jgi:predicted nucleotidyltransferase
MVQEMWGLFSLNASPKLLHYQMVPYLYPVSYTQAIRFMNLTLEDHVWLDAYRKALDEQFPGLVEQIIIFGSKARGTATADSDLDLLVVIREGDWRQKEAVALPGYELSIETDVVPSIIVFTREEWELHRRRQAPFWQTVTRDGVPVA